MTQVDNSLFSLGLHSYHHHHQYRHQSSQHQDDWCVHSTTTKSLPSRTAAVPRHRRAPVQPQQHAATDVAVAAPLYLHRLSSKSATAPVGDNEDQRVLPCERLRRQSAPLLPTKPLSLFDNSHDDDVETIGPFCIEVFLGGSCNPTQWRQDHAIPELKAAQVTYYDPQRADWRPELIELEQQAKENARVLLFVHDKETRSLASMVEVGELSARKKHLVLAIQEQGQGVMGELLSDRELEEMQRARNYMRDIAETCGIRVYTEIRSAVRGCIDVVRRKDKLSKSDKSAIIYDRTIGERFIKLRSAFDGHAADNVLSMNERRPAFPAQTHRRLSKDHLLDEYKQLGFDQFCMIDAKHRKTIKPNLFKEFNLASSLEKASSGGPFKAKQVFIVGPYGEFDWCSTIARPYFEREHVSWQQRQRCNAVHLCRMEMQKLEHCEVLLFVFTADTWGAPEMIMASYYIGLGKHKIVLCIQDVSEGSTIHGEMVTKTQANDYNRSRKYLSNQATRNRVPLFDSIEEAVAKAAEFAKSNQTIYP